MIALASHVRRLLALTLCTIASLAYRAALAIVPAAPVAADPPPPRDTTRFRLALHLRYFAGLPDSKAEADELDAVGDELLCQSARRLSTARMHRGQDIS